MSKVAVTLALRNYDHLAPLACGDVAAEGIDLNLVRDPAAIPRTLREPSIHAGELSLSGHLMKRATGDRSFVAIPVFVFRAFRHRSFFVRRGSPLRELRELAGKRIGTEDWLSTASTWSRAALREQGIPMEGVEWWMGSIDGGSFSAPQGVRLPAMQFCPAGTTLREMLLEGRIDALMNPFPPKGFYEVDSPLVRLIPDYRRAEREYLGRTGIYPPHHLVGLRRELFEREPGVVRALYNALDRSKLMWQEERKRLGDMTPWLLSDLEEAWQLIGQDWRPNGVEPNRAAVQLLCDELFLQGLIPGPTEASEIFAEFEQVMRG